ncbi:major facilitator superfamily domain-containing protein [Flammula alnicola]|nr:major facilitator superfamily domain-containing protein [Flammula alnicola]
MTTPFKERVKSVSLIFACGTALFSDGYANGVIGNVNTLLTRVYGADELSQHNHSRVLSSLGFAGTVSGYSTAQRLFVDKIGRKFGMMTATGIVALFSGLSAASAGAHGSVGGLLSMLSAMRHHFSFLLGIGVGAEYPCGSVSASEQSEEPGINKNSQHRWFALATNSMIDFGFVISSFVPLVLFWIFGNDHLRAVWRLSLGLGVIPALAVFIWRLSMDEPARYKKDSMKYARIPYLLVLRRYGGSLIAISCSCMTSLFIPLAFTPRSSLIGGSSDLTIVLGWNVIINLFYMPGTLGGAFIVDRLGAKYTMITGLLLQAVVGFIMSGAYSKLTEHVAGFAVVYGIFLSFGELGGEIVATRRIRPFISYFSGPGNCLGLLASKSCPTAVRGQFYGTAAAIGKVGAFIGTWMFPPIIDAFGGASSDRGNTGPFWIGSGSIGGLERANHLFFIQPLTTDGMEIEDRKFREYLEQQGYDTTAMGLPGTQTEESIGSVEEGPLDEKKV